MRFVHFIQAILCCTFIAWNSFKLLAFLHLSVFRGNLILGVILLIGGSFVWIGRNTFISLLNVWNAEKIYILIRILNFFLTFDFLFENSHQCHLDQNVFLWNSCASGWCFMSQERTFVVEIWNHFYPETFRVEWQFGDKLRWPTLFWITMWCLCTFSIS